MFDIIPDIHGQSGKLEALLQLLGWRRTTGGWTNDYPTRENVFLGDFIDRGSENAAVIRIVRSLIDAGKARAVMGNHELNAIHFHTEHDSQPSAYLRPHTHKNMRQHATFLGEFPLGAPRTQEVIAWMRTLPLFLELSGFRAVHACWDDATVAQLATMAPDGVLTETQFARAAARHDPLWRLVETLTKGPEVRLPVGHSFHDKDGTVRHEVRIKWWKARPSSWGDIAMSVPDQSELPRGAPPAAVLAATYPENAKPVFFGHYWLTGTPELQAPNALCLDYSAGTDGPLVAYRLDNADAPLSPAHIVGVGKDRAARSLNRRMP